MRPKLFFILLLVCIAFTAAAQEKKIKFHSINSVGLLAGEHNSDLALETVNGIAYNNLYSGIGFGLDYYNYNSYPIFFDQRIFFNQKRCAFAYGDIGYNLPGQNKPGKEIYYYESFHFSGGVYSDFGIGYQMKMPKQSSFVITAGLSYKELHDKIATMAPADGTDYSTYNYGFGRIIIKAGIEF